MSSSNIYTLRTGKPLPIMGSGGESSGIKQYTFGSECQAVIACSNENTVLKSEEFCLMGGEWISANYRALPNKVNGNIVYNATLKKVPVILSSTNGCGGTGQNACSIISF